MRKKIAGGVGTLVAVIVGALLADWSMAPAELPLRVGMTEREVNELLGFVRWNDDEEADAESGSSSSHGPEVAATTPTKVPRPQSEMAAGDGAETTDAGQDGRLSIATYKMSSLRIEVTRLDWLGNNPQLTIHFDGNRRVTHWETKLLPRTCPPWLAKAMTGVGL